MKNAVRGALREMSRRREIAEKFLSEGRCQIQECKGRGVKVVEFVSGQVLSLCNGHTSPRNEGGK